MSKIIDFFIKKAEAENKNKSEKDLDTKEPSSNEDFEAIFKKNQENKERMIKQRKADNRNVIISYGIKNND